MPQKTVSIETHARINVTQQHADERFIRVQKFAGATALPPSGSLPLFSWPFIAEMPVGKWNLSPASSRFLPHWFFDHVMSFC